MLSRRNVKRPRHVRRVTSSLKLSVAPSAADPTGMRVKVDGPIGTQILTTMNRFGAVRSEAASMFVSSAVAAVPVSGSCAPTGTLKKLYGPSNAPAAKSLA